MSTFVDLTDLSLADAANDDQNTRHALRRAYDNAIRQLEFGADAAAFAN